MISKRITVKLIVLISAVILPTMLVVSYAAYKVSSSLIKMKTEEQASLIIANSEYEINQTIMSVEKIPATLALNLPAEKKSLEDLMKRTLLANKDIFGIAAAFEPYSFDSSTKFYCPYFYGKSGEITFKLLEMQSYYTETNPWYNLPKKLNAPVWSEPYADQDSDNELMSTYSFPVEKNGSFAGIISVDVSLEKMSDILENLKILESGYVFLISANETLMVHPDRNAVMKKKFFEYISDKNSKDFSELETEMIKNDSGTGEYTINGVKKVLFYKKMPTTGWTVGTVFPKDEMFKPVKHLSGIIIIISLLGCGFAAASVCIISNKVTKGMHSLTISAQQIAGGDFTSEMPVMDRKDELGTLSASFESMRRSLVQYIDDLKISETAKQRIESELSIAREIQMSILPKVFPPFPDREDVDIFAVMKAAREVGGDLYDFYFLDGSHLCFLIGDVSGKGVPASLFMAVCKTLIKAVADKNTPAGGIFTKVNNELSQGNDSCMFVTSFIGILNTETGEMSYANAGHNPPAVLSERGVQFLENRIQPPLGAFENVQYATYKTVLGSSDRLILYTDGVTEAIDINGGFFGEKRLVSLLETSKNADSRTITSKLLNAVETFSEGTQQHDDITILSLKRRL